MRSKRGKILGMSMGMLVIVVAVLLVVFRKKIKFVDDALTKMGFAGKSE